MHAITLKLFYIHNDFLLVSVNNVAIWRQVKHKG